MTRIELATQLGTEFANEMLAEQARTGSDVTPYTVNDDIPPSDYIAIRDAGEGDVEPEAERAYKAAFNATIEA